LSNLLVDTYVNKVQLYFCGYSVHDTIIAIIAGSASTSSTSSGYW